jgi:hypothetical protein
MITFSKLLNALFGTRTPSDLARSSQSQWDASRLPSYLALKGQRSGRPLACSFRETSLQILASLPGGLISTALSPIQTSHPPSRNR